MLLYSALEPMEMISETENLPPTLSLFLFTGTSEVDSGSGNLTRPLVITVPFRGGYRRSQTGVGLYHMRIKLGEAEYEVQVCVLSLFLLLMYSLSLSPLESLSAARVHGDDL